MQKFLAVVIGLVMFVAAGVVVQQKIGGELGSDTTIRGLLKPPTIIKTSKSPAVKAPAATASTTYCCQAGTCMPHTTGMICGATYNNDPTCNNSCGNVAYCCVGTTCKQAIPLMTPACNTAPAPTYSGTSPTCGGPAACNPTTKRCTTAGDDLCQCVTSPANCPAGYNTAQTYTGAAGATQCSMDCKCKLPLSCNNPNPPINGCITGTSIGRMDCSSQNRCCTPTSAITCASLGKSCIASDNCMTGTVDTTVTCPSALQSCCMPEPPQPACTGRCDTACTATETNNALTNCGSLNPGPPRKDRCCTSAPTGYQQCKKPSGTAPTCFCVSTASTTVCAGATTRPKPPWHDTTIFPTLLQCQNAC